MLFLFLVLLYLAMATLFYLRIATIARPDPMSEARPVPTLRYCLN